MWKRRKAMANGTRVYGEVDHKEDLHRVFSQLRRDVDAADSRADLTQLYRRAGYLIALTYAPSWEEKHGRAAADLRQVAEKEFGTTARRINGRARQIGTEAGYDETWGNRH
jgi:hypothetical protein